MRKLLIGIVVLALLVVLVLVGGLAALNSDAVRTRLASELSSALGQPVTIGGLSVSVFPNVALSAKNVKVGGAGPEAAPGMSLAGLRVVPRLSSVLPGRTLVIDRVELDGLAIAVRRAADGKWLLPAVPAPAPGPAKPSEDGAPSVDLQQLVVRNGQIRVVDDSLQTGGKPTVTTITDIAARVQAVGGVLKVPVFSGKLGQTAVEGGAALEPSGATLALKWASLSNADLPSVFALAGMRPYPGLAIGGKAPFELLVRMAPGFGSFVVTGKAAFDSVRFGTLTLEQLQAPFRFEKSVFTLEPLTFVTYKGKQAGSVRVDLTTAPSTFRIKTTLDGLDIDQALTANTTLKHYMQGTGNLKLDVTASGSDAKAIQRSLKGTVAYQLDKGVIHDFPMVAAIDQALGVTGGSGKELQFDKLTGTAVLGDGAARTNDLTLLAGALTVTGAGTIGFDQSLDLKMMARFNATKSAELAAKAGPAGALRNKQGEIEVPFTVTGTTLASKTRVDLGGMAKARAKEQVQEGVQKGLQKLFGKPKP